MASTPYKNMAPKQKPFGKQKYAYMCKCAFILLPETPYLRAVFYPFFLKVSHPGLLFRNTQCQALWCQS